MFSILLCKAPCCCILFFILWSKNTFKTFINSTRCLRTLIECPCTYLQMEYGIYVQYVDNRIWNRTHTLSVTLHVHFKIQKKISYSVKSAAICKLLCKFPPIKLLSKGIEFAFMIQLWLHFSLLIMVILLKIFLKEYKPLITSNNLIIILSF